MLSIEQMIGKLEGRVREASYRIQKTEEDAKKALVYSEALQAKELELKRIQAGKERIKNIITDLQEYNDNKQKKALSGIYAGIYAVRTIIPESMPISLSMQGGEAHLVTERGDLVNLIEGSALRAMLSYFSRDVVTENTDYLDFYLLDEPFSTVSPENSSELSNFFEVFGKRKQIILIEQKEDMFSNNTNLTTYRFKKLNGVSTVNKE